MRFTRAARGRLGRARRLVLRMGAAGLAATSERRTVRRSLTLRR